jgi:putative glutamine amidotransferase
MSETAGPAPAPGPPVIGIGANLVRAKWAVWDRPATLIPQTYIDLLAAAGCVPVLLPPHAGIAQAVHRLDGLVLPGGGDLDPALYGAPRHPATGQLNPRRDAAEVALAKEAIKAGIPILGVCRGLQVINTVLGGTLHQHLPDITGHVGHEPRPGLFGRQLVRFEDDSQMALIAGGRTATVPCHHHQSIDRLGAGLTVTAWSEDGVIEAVEMAGHPFAVAIQWHAEEDGGMAEGLFLALVDAARRARDRAGHDSSNGRSPASAAPRGWVSLGTPASSTRRQETREP